MTDRAETCPHRDECWQRYSCGAHYFSGPPICVYEHGGDVATCPIRRELKAGAAKKKEATP